MKSYFMKWVMGFLSLCLGKGALASTFVLVHGAFGNAQVWNPTKQLLETAGHSVVAVNLPAHGGDPTALNDITLESYVMAIEQKIAQTKGPVILVGHSLAGMIISQVAEDMPGKIERLVYVSAFLPQNGDSVFELFENDKKSILGKYLNFSQDKKTATIRAEGRVIAVCADCPIPMQNVLATNDSAEPMQPFSDKVKLSHRYFGTVPKAYLLTTNDKALSYEAQQWLVKRSGQMVRTAVLHTSHLPFLVNPEKFTAILLSLAQP